MIIHVPNWLGMHMHWDTNVGLSSFTRCEDKTCPYPTCDFSVWRKLIEMAHASDKPGWEPEELKHLSELIEKMFGDQ